MGNFPPVVLPFPDTPTLDPTPTLLLFSALGLSPFRTIKLRARKPTCPACSPAARLAGGLTESTDYVQFCGGAAPDWVSAGLAPGLAGHRVNPDVLATAMHEAATEAGTERIKGNSYRIIDVRPPTEFGICSLPGSESAFSDSLPVYHFLIYRSTDIPLKQVLNDPSKILSGTSDIQPTGQVDSSRPPKEIFVVCRLGNDSQIAAQALRQAAVSLAAGSPPPSASGEPPTPADVPSAPLSEFMVMDVVGGLRGWSLSVNNSFPLY